MKFIVIWHFFTNQPSIELEDFFTKADLLTTSDHSYDPNCAHLTWRRFLTLFIKNCCSSQWLQSRDWLQFCNVLLLQKFYYFWMLTNVHRWPFRGDLQVAMPRWWWWSVFILLQSSSFQEERIISAGNYTTYLEFVAEVLPPTIKLRAATRKPPPATRIKPPPRLSPVGVDKKGMTKRNNRDDDGN